MCECQISQGYHFRQHNVESQDSSKAKLGKSLSSNKSFLSVDYCNNSNPSKSTQVWCIQQAVTINTFYLHIKLAFHIWGSFWVDLRTSPHLSWTRPHHPPEAWWSDPAKRWGTLSRHRGSPTPQSGPEDNKMCCIINILGRHPIFVASYPYLAR